MPAWAWTALGAAGGGLVVGVGGCVWLAWYFNRNTRF